MYAKLFRKNIKKALEDYVIYFFTLAVSSTLFFAFFSLTSRYNDILGGDGNYSLALFQDTIRYAVLAVSIIFIVLIRYINTYMLKQRSRELSVYMILGMEQRTIAGQFFGETFVFGIAAVFTGCILGTVLSGMMTVFVLRTIGSTGTFRLGFYPDTMLVTLLFFGMAFLFIGAWNIRKIYKIKLIDLLNEKKVNEEQQRKKGSYLVSLVTALICFGTCSVVLYNFSHMNGIYAGNIPEEISNRYQTVAVVVAIAGIFALYNTLAFLLSVVRRRSKWKNRNINSVLLGNLFRKVSSTAKILSISTLAITVSLVAFVILPMLAEITTGYLDYRMPYDIMIYNTYRYIDQIDDIPEVDFSFVGDILKEHGIVLSEEVSQKSYFVWERDFNTVDTREYWNDLPRLAMRISEYNAMREMAGFEPVPLADNEFFMHLDFEMDMESTAEGIGTRKIQLDDGTLLELAETPVTNEPLGQYLFNSDGSVLVFPDIVCDHLHLARTCYYADTETVIPYKLCDIIREEISGTFKEHYKYLFTQYEAKYGTDKHYTSFIDPIRFRTQENNDTVLTATSVRLLGIYSGILFFIICMTVLALHGVADTIDNRMQYRTLYQIGVDREDIVKMVSRQSLHYFFTPCVIAFMIALLLIYSFIVRYGHKVFTYIGSTGFRFGVMIPSLLIVLILVCYYGATIYTIKRNLTRTLNNHDFTTL
ncbi:MAG: ABC transporter permease [Lachnospiraceae bacterium]|nr:ABC transporter permease [Lachnospiraceae bacterium]